MTLDGHRRPRREIEISAGDAAGPRRFCLDRGIEGKDEDEDEDGTRRTRCRAPLPAVFGDFRGSIFLNEAGVSGTKIMRILHVTPSYYPAIRYGGTIFAVHDLSSGLASLGHDVDVFTTNRDGPGVTAVPIGTPVTLDGVRVTYFAADLLPRLYLAPAMKKALAAKIKSTDLVFIHSVFLWPTTIAARVARAAGVPYVASPHGMLVKNLIASRSRLLKMAWIRLFERTNYERAAAIRVTSRYEEAELARFGWPLRKVLRIPNAANLPKPYEVADVSPDILALIGQEPVILYFGRMSLKKGIDRLIAGLPHVSRGRLAIVGTDDEGLAAGFTRTAARHGVADRVTILPRLVDGADKEHLFRSAAVFALVSHSENFGNTVLEAMARGAPVVVTPEVGASEMVLDAGAGLVVDGDPVAVGAALNGLLADPERRARMGAAGESYSRLKCSRAGLAQTMSAAIEEIVATHRHDGASGTGPRA
jgi:glycosyltransferase involved in cell wall biosynthesis